MKKLILLSLFFFVGIYYSNAQKKIRDGFELLSNLASQIEIRESLNTPSHIYFKNETKLSADELILEHLLPLLPEGNSLNLDKITEDQLNYTHRSYNQTYMGIPVEGGVYKISQNSQGLSYAGGYLYPIESKGPITLSESEALNAALAHVGATSYKWQNQQEENYLKTQTNNANASYFPKANVVILPTTQVNGEITYRQAFKFDVYADSPTGRYYVYVDAQNGKILRSFSRLHNANGVGNTLYNGTQNAQTEAFNSQFRLRQNTPQTNGNRIINTYDMNQGKNFNNAVDFIDADNNWTTNTNQDLAGYSAHWAAEQTWDFYKQYFDRNSFDNLGGAINSFVHYDINLNNAYWDGQRMLYGDGDGISYSPLVAVDICGHEITHGVTEYSSGLIYQNESGALNESFSDIFGTAIEFFTEGNSADYLIAEDVTLGNTSGIRSLSNPNSHNQPDTYNGTYWHSNSAFPNIADDYGGVHYNSGVQNFWYYLLCEGGSGTNDVGNTYIVNAIGMNKAIAIAYRNNTTKLTPNSTYADARAGSIASAIELFGQNSIEVKEVTNAWYAVNVGAAFSGTVATCPDPEVAYATVVLDNSAQLNFSMISSATDYDIQYRIGESGVWNDVNTNDNPYILNNLSSNTHYQFHVRANCGNQTSGYSPIAEFVTKNPNGTAYCIPPASSSSYFINKVVLGGINNTSGNNNGYGNFIHLKTDAQIGETVNFSLTPGNSYFSSSMYWRIWIDYNRDGDFEDSGEMVYSSPANITGVATGTFTIPANALVGPTRMRIADNYATHIASCGTSSQGEFEDYTIKIIGAPSASCDVPQSLTSNSITNSSAFLNWQGEAGANSYVVRYQASGGPWDSVAVTQNSAQLNNLTSNTTYNWSVRSVCGSGSSSANSNIQSFTTLQNTPVNCDAPINLQSSNVTTSDASLSWQAVSGASTYTVRYRINGQTWDSLNANSNVQALTGLQANTNYEWSVRTNCGQGNSSAYSSIANFSTLMANPNPTYCDSRGNNAGTEWIQSVTIGTITNNSGGNAGYGDFTSIQVNAQQGSSVNFTLAPGFYLFSYAQYWRIWIDYNQDGDFTDAGELAYDHGNTTTSSISGNISIPSNALVGNTRLRIQMKYNGLSTSCETFARGEVEDYTIAISGTSAPACVAPSGLQTTDITSTSAKVNWSASTGGASYWVRYRKVGFAWDSLQVTSTQVTLTGLSASSNYEWTTRTVCSGNSESENSIVKTFITASTSPPPTSYCNSKGNNSTSEWIQKVNIGTFSKTSGNNGGYGNFISDNIQGTAGSNLTVSLTPGFSTNIFGTQTTYPEYWRIWVDFNQDGDFDDSGELAFDAGSTSTSTVNGQLVIPSSATPGSTRLRVQMKYNSASTSCETFSSGEVEDYTLIIGSAALAANQHGYLDLSNEEVSFEDQNTSTNAIQELQEDNLLNIYPNPATEEFSIESEHPVSNWEIIDQSGKIIKTSTQTTSSPIFIGDLNKGIYIVRILSDRGIKQLKLVKQ